VLVGFSVLGVALIPVLHRTVRSEDRASQARAATATADAAGPQAPGVPVAGSDR
jgi:type II secretory pathway pseudopilin PulG